MGTWTQGLNTWGVGRSYLKWWMLSGEEWFRAANVGILTTTWRVVQRLHCTKMKWQRDFLDGQGMFLGQEPWNLLPSYCQIGQQGCVSQAPWVPDPSSPLTRPWDPTGSIFWQDNALVYKAAVVINFFSEIQHPGWWLAILFLRPEPHQACLGRAQAQTSLKIPWHWKHKRRPQRKWMQGWLKCCLRPGRRYLRHTLRNCGKAHPTGWL